MHDCSGLGLSSSGAPERWARELVQRGYVILIPDSFTTRGHAVVCAPTRHRAGPRLAPPAASVTPTRHSPTAVHCPTLMDGGSGSWAARTVERRHWPPWPRQKTTQRRSLRAGEQASPLRWRSIPDAPRDSVAGAHLHWCVQTRRARADPHWRERTTGHQPNRARSLRKPPRMQGIQWQSRSIQERITHSTAPGLCVMSRHASTPMLLPAAVPPPVVIPRLGPTASAKSWRFFGQYLK
jgi:hypothetical protein